MSPAHHDPEGNGLTVLTVREGEACIRDFRFDCRGETSCRAELGELLQLLERRHADIAIFLAHPTLVGSLIEELRRRGGAIPEMVIASPTDAADARVTVSLSLSGLSESAYPQELLARLYEALRATQGKSDTPFAAANPQMEGVPQVADESAAATAESVADTNETARDHGAATAVGEAESAELGLQNSAPEAALAAVGDVAGDQQATDPGREETSADEADGRMDAELEELSVRLEIVLNQRLQQSEP
jgi:hypothetical protein